MWNEVAGGWGWGGEAESVIIISKRAGKENCLALCKTNRLPEVAPLLSQFGTKIVVK